MLSSFCEDVSFPSPPLRVNPENYPVAAPNKERPGIVTLSWNSEDPEEVVSAERVFREYTRKGWLAFAVDSDNKKKQVFSFSPEWGRIMLVPIVEGG